MTKLLTDQMSRADLSSTERVALFLLHTHRKSDGYSYLTSAELGEMLGVSPVAVSVIARRLADENLVRRVAAKGRGRKRWQILALVGAIAVGSIHPSQAAVLPDDQAAVRSLIKTQEDEEPAEPQASAAA